MTDKKGLDLEFLFNVDGSGSIFPSNGILDVSECQKSCRGRIAVVARFFEVCTAAVRWLGEPVVLTDRVGSN